MSTTIEDTDAIVNGMGAITVTTIADISSGSIGSTNHDTGTSHVQALVPVQQSQEEEEGEDVDMSTVSSMSSSSSLSSWSTIASWSTISSGWTSSWSSGLSSVSPPLWHSLFQSNLSLSSAPAEFYTDREIWIDTTVVYNQDKAALHCAFWQAAKTCNVKALLDCIMTDSEKDDGFDIDFNKLYALHFARKKGIRALIQFLADEYDVNALHFACEYGFLDIVEYLVNKCKMDTSIPDGGGMSALHLACYHNHLDIIDYLINVCKCDIYMQHPPEYKTVLHCVGCESRQLELINYLTKNGTGNINLNLQDWYGMNILHYAVAYYKFEMIQYFTNNCSIDGNLQDLGGRTVLHIAVRTRRLELVKYLAKGYNINMNLQDCDGCTVLHIAIINYDIGMIEYLINQNNINVDLHCWLYKRIAASAWSSILNTTEWGRERLPTPCVRYATQKEKFKSGHTELHIAIKLDRMDVVRLLIDKGADIAKTTHDGKNVFDLAFNSRNRNDFVVMFLTNCLIPKK